MIYSVLNAFFLLSYLASTLVQYNDPDPWSWIAIYLAAAGMCVAWFSRRLPSWCPALLLVTSLLWIGALLLVFADAGADGVGTVWEVHAAAAGAVGTG